jgi:OST3 / OST6 family, transporter family
MTVFSLVILTYFAVVSGIVYDVIVEPPGIGSVQDPMTRAVKPVVFLPGRVNGQYIIEGLSSGFMFVLGGLGIISMDLAMDRGRAHSVRVSLASFGIAAVVISYAMSMLFIRIKIPGYLWWGLIAFLLFWSVVRSVCIGNDSKCISFCVTSHFFFSFKFFSMMGGACWRMPEWNNYLRFHDLEVGLFFSFFRVVINGYMRNMLLVFRLKLEL